MKCKTAWTPVLGIGFILATFACSSNDSGGGASSNATGGSSAGPGGAKATGGSSGNTGGVSATGGAATGGAATGGAATGGAATGGAATGGANASTGGTSGNTGGASGTGGSSAAITCPVDNQSSDGAFYQTTAFCTPTNPDLNLITGTVSLSTINLNASGGTIAITGTPPFVGPIAFTRPFNSSNCTNSGLNATVTGSNPAQLYTGLTVTVANAQSTSTTLNIYLADRVTVNGTGYYVVGTASITVGANTSVTRTVRWADLSTNCSMGSAAAFDPTQILALTLGFPNTNAVNLTISNVSFSTT